MENNNEHLEDVTYHSEREKAKNPEETETEITGKKSLEDPGYLELMFEMTKENKLLKAKVEVLEKNVARLEADTSAELHAIQLESVEKIISQQKLEIERLKADARQQYEISQKQLNKLKEENDSVLMRFRKEAEQAVKERDAMVMKYAVSEKSAINLQRIIGELENKLKDSNKEKESLHAKINAAAGEKVKLALIIDGKNTEITNLEREITRKKDELHSQSSNLKFFQNKLKQEMESHRETQTKLEKLQQKLREAKEETEQVRKDSQEMLRRYEMESRQVLQKQETTELTSLQSQVEVFRQRVDELLEENSKLHERIKDLENGGLDNESGLSEQGESVLSQNLNSQLEETQLLLEREKERLIQSRVDVDRLQQCNQDLQKEINQCREREAELLVFTRKLTEKDVVMQSETCSLKSKLQQLEVDLSMCTGQLETIKDEILSLKMEQEKERNEWLEEKEMLSRHLREKSETSERLSQKLEDLIGENQLMKKKHMASIKELTRELQHLRRKGENLDTASLSQGSHTSSNNSLNNIDYNESRMSLPANPIQVHSLEPDRQLLIEKIVKVQRSNARKQEKIDFLEEHAQQLVLELKKKTKIIQNMALKQQPGALVSESMDENKLTHLRLGQAALSKHGGIMASVYTTKPCDESITLELSLEMNRKLQAVLEDTLLKNITLKENIETLGNEIARLAAKSGPGA